jgi:hypothetical protein
MKTFWGEIYDGVKDRRYGMLFLTTLAAVFGLCALAMLLGEILRNSVNEGSDAAIYLEQILPTILFLIFAALIWIGIHRHRPLSQKTKFQRQQLSQIEITKARLKLVRNRNHI